MRAWKLSAWLSVGMSLMASFGYGRPVDFSAPTGEVGSSNMRGYLEVWREIHEVGLDLGKGSYLPLRYRFSSEDNTEGILGAGFYVPLFEAHSVLIREQMMKANLPCGKALYMRRDTADASKFQTLDQQWTGQLSEDGEDFTLWRNDGWKLLYHKGRLTTLTTDNNRTFAWYYDTGVGASVRENGESILTVEPDAAGHVAAFVFDGKRYEVEFTPRPITQVLLGQVAIKELDDTLSSFRYPSGEIERFTFSLSPDRVPILKFTDANKAAMVYSWDAFTGHIASEDGAQGNWKYQIGKTTGQFDIPTVARTNLQGGSQSVAIDNKLGTTTEKALDGEVTVRTVFETPGPLYGKLREVTDSAHGVDVVLRFGYDETGRLIRKIDSNGFITALSYGVDGKVIKQVVLPPSDPAILDSLKVRENVFLKAISDAKTPSEKDDILQQLAFFYIYQAGDIAGALSQIKNLSDPNRAFAIKMQAILGNRNLLSSDRATQLQALAVEYPDQKEQLSTQIASYQAKAN